MKKILSLVIILTLFSGSSISFAKSGTGGSSTPQDQQAEIQAQKAREEAAAAEAAQQEAARQEAAAQAAQEAAQQQADEQAAQEAAAKAEADREEAERAAQAADNAAKAQEEAAAQAALKAKQEKLKIQQETLEIEHCGKKTEARDRILCRLQADEKTLQAEFADDYKPESCIWWNNNKSDDWNNAWINKCKDRYRKEQQCWADKLYDGKSYNGAKVISCLKTVLELPQEIIPVTEYCEGKAESCPEEYQKAVHHLIVGRFYDAENRVEEWMAEGRLSLEATADALVWITDHKKDFYSAESKDERKEVIKSFQTQWDLLTDSLQ